MERNPGLVFRKNRKIGKYLFGKLNESVNNLGYPQANPLCLRKPPYKIPPITLIILHHFKQNFNIYIFSIQKF